MQVVGRVLEVALHKAHELHFPLENIVDGTGLAPLPPPGADFMSAMGRTNDATLYGGAVTLFVEGPEEEAKKLAEGLPSSTSRDHGKTFGEIFAAYKGDFYAMDPMLFSPAKVSVTALSTGKTFVAGEYEAGPHPAVVLGGVNLAVIPAAAKRRAGIVLRILGPELSTSSSGSTRRSTPTSGSTPAVVDPVETGPRRARS